MRSGTTDFQVHCPSCDVTFAIGTRNCIHCGGPTLRSGRQPGKLFGRKSRLLATGSVDLNSEWDGETAFPALADETQTEPVAGMAGQFAPLDPLDPLNPLNDGEQDSEEAGPGRSILRSFGSLIWIALLIAFSLSGRACGE